MNIYECIMKNINKYFINLVLITVLLTKLSYTRETTNTLPHVSSWPNSTWPLNGLCSLNYLLRYSLKVGTPSFIFVTFDVFYSTSDFIINSFDRGQVCLCPYIYGNKYIYILR